MEKKDLGIKIVLVEDDRFLAKILIFRLEQEGFEVALASDGGSAVGIVRSKKPEIVLLDLVLPKKSGFEVLEELKRDPELVGIPVVILSNLGQQSDIDRGRQLGAIDYLVKANFSIQEIIAKIKEHLTKVKK